MNDQPITTAIGQGPCPSFWILSSRFLGEYLEKIRRAVELLDDDDVWWRPAQGNSIGNLLLHLCGNLSLWLGQGIGGVPYDRDRWGEFTAERSASGADLLDELESVVERCRKTLEDRDREPLDTALEVQGYKTNPLGVVYHAVEHMAYHTGQILFAAKHLVGDRQTIELYPQHRGE